MSKSNGILPVIASNLYMHTLNYNKFRKVSTNLIFIIIVYFYNTFSVVAQQITVDPALDGKIFASGGLTYTTDQIIDAYNKHSHGWPLALHNFIAFSADDGATYIVAIHKKTKVFKILEFPVDQIEAAIKKGEQENLSHDLIKAQLRQKFPAFELSFPESERALFKSYRDSPETMRKIAAPLPNKIEKIEKEYKRKLNSGSR